MQKKEIQSKHNRWIYITNPTTSDVQSLNKKFGFHTLTLDNVCHGAQRSKLDVYDGKYYFLVLLFPVFNKERNEFIEKQINFFIGKNYIITLLDGSFSPLEKVFTACQKNSTYRNKLFSKKGSSLLLYEIFYALFSYPFPILDKINIQIEDLELKIFQARDKHILEDILMMRRSITDLRRILQPHTQLIQRLLLQDEEHKLLALQKNKIYFDNIIEDATEAWNSLEEYKEAIEVLHQTNESLISYKINNVMKKLTLISVVVLPMSLVAGVFGMNAVNIPGVGHELDFFLLLGCVILSGFILLMWIASKRGFK